MQPKPVSGGMNKRVLSDDTNNCSNNLSGRLLKRSKTFKTVFSEKRNQMRDLHIATLEQLDKDMGSDHPASRARNSRCEWAAYLALPGFAQLDKDEQDGWRLSAILFDDDTEKPRWTRFREWLLDRVSKGAELAAKRVQLHVPNDPYAVVFEYLTHGCIEHAARAAIELANDEAMSCLIAMSPTSSTTLRQTIRDLFGHSIATNAFDTFSPYEKRCWYALCGHLEKCMAIDGNMMDWRQAFVLYMLYYWVDEDQDPMDAVMEHYVQHVEPTFFAHRNKEDIRPTWFVVFRWWWIQQYHLELAFQNSHPLHLQDWSPRLAYCFTRFFPKALLPAKNKEITERFLYELKRIGVPDEFTPETIKY